MGDGIRWEEVSEPWRDIDFLFSVRLRSSKKWVLSASEPGATDFGDVGGTGEDDDDE